MMNNKKITGLRYSKDNWFTCIDTEVLTDRQLSSTAKLVFSVLCIIAGFGYRECSPGVDEVADIADVSVRTVQRVYRELEARGIIIREGEIIRLIGHNAACYSEEEER